MVVGRHSVAPFDLGSLVAVEYKNQLDWEPGESSEAKQKCSKGRVLACLSMCTVPPALLALFEPRTRIKRLECLPSDTASEHKPCIHAYDIRRVWGRSLVAAPDGERDEGHRRCSRLEHLTNDGVSFSACRVNSGNVPPTGR